MAGVKLRVGFLSRYPPMHCGVGEYTRMLTSALKSIEQGAEVVILTSTQLGRSPWVDEELGVKVIPSFRERGVTFSEVLDALSDLGGVDVLHVQHEYGIFGTSIKLIDAIEEGRKEGLIKKAVITTHTVLHPYSGKVKELGFQARLNSFDAVVVHSVPQEYELQWHGIKHSKIFRIPHGTLINPYLGHPREVLAKSLGINPRSLKGLTLTVPGFIRPDKGLDTLFEALNYLENLNSTVVIAGEPRDKAVMDLIEEVRARRNVILIEKYLTNDEILRVVGLADALVLPYRDRPGYYSVSGILHLSMGGLKPIVGSKTPRLVELYQYAPRLTVPADSPYELSKMLKWVVENYDYAVAYMATLYSYAARTQWVRMARRHLNLYLKLLVGKELETAPLEGYLTP